jgi:superfamily I DNA and RNA helicase
LADHLREQSADVENLDVASFHQVCDRWIERAFKKTGRDLLAEVRREFPRADGFSHHMPIALANAIDLLGPKYDAIVVDEGQDFGDEFWLPVEMLLNDLEQSLLYVFLDENQDVFHRSAKIPIEGEPMLLNQNCRNTTAIHSAAYRYYRGTPMESPEIPGTEVELLPANDIKSQAVVLGRVLTRLISEQKVEPHDIAVLLCEGSAKVEFEKALSSFPKPSNCTLGRLEDYKPGVVVVDTVARFKGLERAVVILWAMDHCSPSEDRATLYVGMSRAKSLLYLCGTRAACERVIAATGL